MNQENVNSAGSGWRWLAVGTTVLLVVTGAWVVVGWVLPQYYFGDDTVDQGARGDAFGAVSALFSGLAFAGVIVAILMQRQELELQRLELKQTRSELRGQKEALQHQLAALNQQRFEATIFQMINLHHEIVNAMSVPVSGRAGSDAPRGREAIDLGLSRRLTASLQAHAIDPEVVVGADGAVILSAFNEVAGTYDSFYESYGLHIGHYFRNLYHIFKTIDQSDVADKKAFGALVRAQLSTPELSLLFYNSFTKGFEKFKPLILRYDVLQSLPRDNIASPSHWILFDRVQYDSERDGALVISV